MINPAEWTSRERQIAIVALAIGLSGGMWLGLWSVPTEGLAVPDSTGPGDRVTPAFYPVSSTYFAVPLMMMGSAAYLVYRERQPLAETETLDDVTKAVADGGQTDE